MPAAKKNSTPLQKAAVKAVKSGAKAAKLPGTMSSKSRNSSQMAQEFNAGYISGKKDIAAAKRNQAAKGEFAGVVAKNAARSAKRPGSASAPSRPGVNTSGYNTASVAAKKDMAAFKRGQAKKK